MACAVSRTGGLTANAWCRGAQRDAAGADTEREQASGSQLRRGPAREQPAAAGSGAESAARGDGARRRRRRGADRAAAARALADAGSDRLAGPGAQSMQRTPGGAGTERQVQGERSWRQRGGETAQREHIGAACGALAAVHDGELVALARGVEDAVGETAHQRRLLMAPGAGADRVQQRAHLRCHAGAPRAAVHQLAHARLTGAHPGGGLGARKALQVAERCRLQLARAEAHAQPLEKLAQTRSVVERGRKVAVLLRAGRAELPPADARAVLVDRAAEGHERQPRARIGDLLAVERGRVEALEGLRVAGAEVAAVEVHPAPAQAPGDPSGDALLQSLELLAQQALGAVATQKPWAHWAGLWILQARGGIAGTRLARGRTPLGECFDLAQAECAHVGAGALGPVPRDGPLERLRQAPPRAPSELAFSRARVECEVSGLRRALGFVRLPAETLAPQGAQPLEQPADRLLILLAGPEVPGSRDGRRARELLREEQVTAERVQHVLPRAHGVGIAHPHGIAAGDCARGVCDQPVLAPVATADHVARSGGGDPRPALAAEERAAIRGRDELCAGLRARV